MGLTAAVGCGDQQDAAPVVQGRLEENLAAVVEGPAAAHERESGAARPGGRKPRTVPTAGRTVPVRAIMKSAPWDQR